ncbi:MAG: hypothetical protein HKO66_13715 [Saprospiraceae bacterium]|nr:hypothetical protein [Bacteroidia bacterium]NNE13750.1 hypothetical protein [Saprospiraceae bacterium]NNL93292.1 hypothetical protein [Saprospiraceae bacterium]
MALKASEHILRNSDHPRAREVADHLASGLTFGQILAQYDFSPETLNKIHFLKSSISTALRSGTPFKEVIDSHFDNPKTREIIMAQYHKHRSMNA